MAIRYLPKGGNNPLKIECYCDASFNSPNENLTKRKTVSRAGFLIFVNGCLIKWFSKVISTTPQSTEEAELHALNEGVRYVEWIRMFLSAS